MDMNMDMAQTGSREIFRPEDMDSRELAELLFDMMHRMSVHHTLWFREVEHQLGFEKAMDVMQEAWNKTKSVMLRRLDETLGIRAEDGVPETLLKLPKEKKLSMLDMVAKDWIAMDGVWFQAVEKRYGMNDAKRCNDSTWGRFSPFEALSVKNLLGLPEHPGLKGLEQALNFRMYGRLNVQSCRYDEEGALIFTMDSCRVQAARRRKQMEAYPCKSAGLVEYSRFAAAIDDRIRTECICCPPDSNTDGCDCGWRFVCTE